MDDNNDNDNDDDNGDDNDLDQDMTMTMTMMMTMILIRTWLMTTISFIFKQRQSWSSVDAMMMRKIDLVSLAFVHLLGHDGEAGGEDDNPFDQVFQLLQVLQSKDISLTPNVNTFIAAKTW